MYLPASSGMSEVHKVRLSLRSCIINVLSLYDSSLRVSSSEIASSKARFARWQALNIKFLKWFRIIKKGKNNVPAYYTQVTYYIFNHKNWLYAIMAKTMIEKGEPFRRVHDLIVENREIQSQTQANGMCRW